MKQIDVATTASVPNRAGEAPRLSVSNVCKAFRIRKGASQPAALLQVLKSISFEVYNNEIVSLIGESGCGKTTLLRIIQGLIHHDSGTLLVEGQPVTGPGRDRGFVFQQPSLLPWRTAQENVEFGLELQRMSATDRAARARKLLQLVGLGDAAEQFPHQLSGGMQQRVGLARALAIEPALLLMDEPFSALDAQTREVLQKELLRIQAETHKTIVFVTHDLDEALYLSDRIIVLGARPGGVKEIIEVPFGSNRPELPLLRGDPRFQALRSRIWELISNRPTL
ncbi:ABC transporter ATP-binding protein [Mangrovibrevibacter kandeliae]|uniref:ABC transporter ATP-binding protein n=1 Tax=Mangrovibrevibacter kandeliae TaxID=2968473 RepID=UPI002119003D|nr:MULTISPECIES: ABC transporter ATP-binding protein [unclassified Aurantimonas]MCQ8781569.1 ABC transporter ATP-binding protein [Aurantimonas sp. CSK15Z-1]MCW4114343.1 ABC transporter ATP-binding protein [Aurantimonas sp. MSK8Z-1]